MKHLLRFLLLSGAFAVGGWITAALLLNIALQTPPIQSRLRTGLGGRVGQEVTFSHAAFVPFRGFVLRGLRISEPAAIGAVELLRARSARVQIRWSALLEGRLEIQECAMDQPEVIALWDESALQLPVLGTLRFASIQSARPPDPGPGPSPNQAPQPDPDLTETPAPERGEVQPEAAAPSGTEAAAPDTAPSSAPPNPPEPASARRTPQVGLSLLFEGLRLREGGFILRRPDADAAPLLEIEGIHLQPASPRTAAENRLSVAALRILGFPVISDLSTPVQQIGNQLLIHDLQAPAAGGEASGQLVIDLAQRGLPFLFAGLLRDARLDRLPVTLPPALGAESLSADARFELRGFALAPSTLQGLGSARLRSEPGRGDADGRGHCRFALQGDTLYLEDLYLATAQFEARARGAVGLSGSALLSVRWFFEERGRRLLELAARELGREPPAIGQLEGREDFFRDVRVTGRPGDYRVDLLGPELPWASVRELLQRAEPAAQSDPGASPDPGVRAADTDQAEQ